MSCELASVPYFKVVDGEHLNYGAGVDVGGAHSLAFENPDANDFEFREETARDSDENKAEKADVTRSSSSSTEESCRPKKTHKFKLKTCCEWAVIGTVIVVLWGLLIFLAIFYRTFQVL